MVNVCVEDKTNEENHPPAFRAKPPTVLQKQPFVPQKSAKRTIGKIIRVTALSDYNSVFF